MASKLYESTESEARNLGRALLLMLEDLDPWHQSQDKYKTEALGMTTNAAGAHEYSKHGMFYRVKPGQPKRPMIYDGFRDQFGKMHAGLTSALLTCWSSDNMFYAPKNALQIALQVLPFFPMIEEHATKIAKAVDDLLQKTDGSITPDMKPALNSYKSQLVRRRKERPCIKEADFSPVSLDVLKIADNRPASARRSCRPRLPPRLAPRPMRKPASRRRRSAPRPRRRRATSPRATPTPRWTSTHQLR
jgi:THO complex subunit 2